MLLAAGFGDGWFWLKSPVLVRLVLQEERNNLEFVFLLCGWFMLSLHDILHLSCVLC